MPSNNCGENKMSGKETGQQKGQEMTGKDKDTSPNESGTTQQQDTNTQEQQLRQESDSSQGSYTQQKNQQDMNSQAQQSYARQRLGQAQELDPKDLRLQPGYLPARHSAWHNSYNAVQAREAERTNAEMPMLESAQEVPATEKQFIPMPDGGLSALNETLFPDDFGDDKAMASHLRDLLVMNHETGIRDDTTSYAGRMVRIK